MAKTTAVAKRESKKTATVEAFMVTDAAGNFQSMSDAFQKRIELLAVDIGDKLHAIARTAEEKVQDALNLTAVFDAWTKVTLKASLPKFVKTFWPKRIPKNFPESYGKPGSKERGILVSTPIFNGIDAMVKKARTALAREKEVQALLDANVDPKDVEQVMKHNKQLRDSGKARFSNLFNDAMIAFHTKGVNQDTLTKLVVFVLGKRTKKTNLPTDAGKKLINDAYMAIVPLKPYSYQAPKEDLAGQLAQTAGDNAAAGKLAKKSAA